MIKFICPDIAGHIGVQQLSIHMKGCMFQTNAPIPQGRQPPGMLAPQPNALMVDEIVCMCYHGDGQHAARALRFTSMRSTTTTYISLCVWFPNDKPRQCVLFGRETPRAHNLKNCISKKVNLIFDLGQIGSTIWARLGNPLSIGPE